ncbi:hypothetical protein CONLIGDRAFT_675240 [Coniochaeta ligniaria NRRL 30616]|uniref:Uncharacterized protein n=1 Tax=Coniochaeta ligniaria NRRL 30616 TaxID=1408157 RepID=A0A1J7J2C8_9PEZI|nr:hypothetical protein CONLIGDRAFT_675240 [Coniochaeta ligniaria NRRL 30616]
MAPRDLRPNTGRLRRPRPSTSQNRRMHYISTVQAAPTARHTASGYRSPSQVWFVPDPPTWSSPTAEKRAVKSATQNTVNHLSQTPFIDEKYRTVESHRVQAPPSPPSQYGGRSTAALDQGLPSPPPTPRIARLRTPDIKPMDDCTPFCDCCAEIDRETDSRWKMELQCQAALDHIRASRSRLRAEGASEDDSQTPLLAEGKRLGGKKVRFEE